MADLICISARDEFEILPSIKNFLSFADKVILARHPASALISLKHEKLVQFRGHQSFIKRLWSALSLSTSSSVFIAADDDFYIPSSAAKIAKIVDKYNNYSSISAITLYASSISNSAITLNPYLISAEILRSHSPCPGNNLFENHILRYFSPLTIDFYTMYNSQKLKSVIAMFCDELSHSTLDSIGTSMKLFQYLFSFSLLFVGDIIPISYPLYVRGVEQALRRQSSYRNNVVQNDELKSFSAEVQQFLADTSAVSDFCNCLTCLVLNKYDSQFRDLYATTVSPGYIHKIMKKILLISVDQIRLDTLSFLCPKYNIQVQKDSCNPKINRSGDDLSFIIPYPQLTKITIPSYLHRIFNPFLLAPEYLYDIQSFCSSIWKSYPNT